MRQITIDNNQSIWDLAIQEYGSMDGVKQLMLDNAKLNFNDNVAAGSKVFINDEMVVNKAVVDYLRKKRIVCATGVTVASAGGGGDFNGDFGNDFL